MGLADWVCIPLVAAVSLSSCSPVHARWRGLMPPPWHSQAVRGVATATPHSQIRNRYRLPSRLYLEGKLTTHEKCQLAPPNSQTLQIGFARNRHRLSGSPRLTMGSPPSSLGIPGIQRGGIQRGTPRLTIRRTRGHRLSSCTPSLSCPRSTQLPRHSWQDPLRHSSQGPHDPCNRDKALSPTPRADGGN